MKPNHLYDSFNRKHTYLRISVSETCNLRCFYCMPDDEVAMAKRHQFLTKQEIVTLADFFIRNGIEKIRITGGEPLMRPDLADLISGINEKARNYPWFVGIGLTTNGIGLHRKLPQLIDHGLNAVNISLDTLNSSKFLQITRRNGFKLTMQAIFTAIDNKNRCAVKVNCVVINGVNETELEEFVELTRHLAIEVRFIEFMPFAGNRWDPKKIITKRNMLTRIMTHFSGTPIHQLHQQDRHATADLYQVENFQGKFGFISSMSDHFCASCNRIRLTADGNLKICLHDSHEASLLPILRNRQVDKETLYAQLDNFVRQQLTKKRFKHGDLDLETGSNRNRSMTRIGG
ncbi:Molybdenum cofactor synthesis protein 1 [Cichlidogyrus casuarinus]|uniref:GTP 3',8-cyclase n=1 Tax=Cichlidogyrus casuarinus TaxID=1844966 RepID=A0ABD2PXK7_9PLAT